MIGLGDLKLNPLDARRAVRGNAPTAPVRVQEPTLLRPPKANAT